jgi:heme exporter protein A
MLSISNLSFEYADVPLLSGVDFHVSAGELLHIQGENGAGKSTLLKIIASLIRPLAGEIFFEHRSIYECLEDYKARVCYLGHLEGVHPLLTPKEVWTLEMIHTAHSSSLARVSEALQLEDILEVPFGLLSAGQKKRVGMIRLMMQSQAKIWLLDEPWAVLDVVSATRLVSLVTHHLSEGGIVITTSHQPLPAMSCCVREYKL